MPVPLNSPAQVLRPAQDGRHEARRRPCVRYAEQRPAVGVGSGGIAPARPAPAPASSPEPATATPAPAADPVPPGTTEGLGGLAWWWWLIIALLILLLIAVVAYIIYRRTG